MASRADVALFLTTTKHNPTPGLIMNNVRPHHLTYMYFYVVYLKLNGGGALRMLLSTAIS